LPGSALIPGLGNASQGQAALAYHGQDWMWVSDEEKLEARATELSDKVEQTSLRRVRRRLFKELGHRRFAYFKSLTEYWNESHLSRKISEPHPIQK
jgi:hypothetical protein